MGIIATIVVGLIVGFLASLIMKTRGGLNGDARRVTHLTHMRATLSHASSSTSGCRNMSVRTPRVPLSVSPMKSNGARDMAPMVPGNPSATN